MSDRKDAIVIGASVGGLVAATYLARAGHNVSLLEAEDFLGGSCRVSSSIAGVQATFGGETIHALDPQLISDLGLRVRFAVRDMPLIALREDGRYLVLGRDARASSRAITAYSPRDAATYRQLHSEIFALARVMRPFWWCAADGLPALNASQRKHLTHLSSANAISFLNIFESDALKATLTFEAHTPLEPGSALALVWNAAQEMCGLQGAVATPIGGMNKLIDVLVSAAQSAGVEIRTRARVSRLILDGNAVFGAVLDTGEEISGRAIVSSLSRRETLLGLAPTASAGFAETQRLLRATSRSGEASILFALNAAPDFGGRDLPQTARFIIADRVESYWAGAASVREGQLPDDLLLEVTVPTAADPSLAPTGQYLISVLVPGLPLEPKDGWPALTGRLVERVVATLERHTSHLRERIVATDVRMPIEQEINSVTRLLASYPTRIATPIEGLFLCGTSAEPMNAISGRAGRLAAGVAHAFLGREKRS